MQLSTAVSRKEMTALEQFVTKPEFKRLTEFQGAVIKLDDTILAGGWMKGDRDLFASDRLPVLAVGTFGIDDEVRVNLQGGILHYNSRYKIKGPMPRQENTFTYRTAMPPIPNHIKDKAKSGDAVLFEVDKWERMQNEPRPALEDPALLRHIVGNLYGVVVTWDLTKAERAALQKYLV